jgi:TonB-dependent SusC/RagA subfamily outer membrane receptor
MKKLTVQLIIIFLIIFNSSYVLTGQQKVVEGMVTTFDSIPIIAASVKVKSTKEVAFTDTLGWFSVSCAPKDRLMITAEGFSGRSLKIKESTKLVLVNLRLLPGPENRELAIGYGHVKDAEKLYAISNVNENDLDFGKYSSVYDIIEKEFASTVQVRSNGSLVIRSTVTMDADNSALLILDGREIDAIDFGNINTTDIASINVLKDASASVYGSRGGNGVIIVETKRGGSKY